MLRSIALLLIGGAAAVASGCLAPSIPAWEARQAGHLRGPAVANAALVGALRGTSDCAVHTVFAADVGAPSKRTSLSEAVRAQIPHAHRFQACVN